MTKPKISVIMPVYNGSKYLSEAIESIRKQTYTDFEFLIIDDGSTDDSLAIIQKQNDTRIKILQNNKNKGIAHSLNKALEKAQGDYLARMDADDISLPKRFETQVRFLDTHPEVFLCATGYQEILADGELLAKFCQQYECTDIIQRIKENQPIPLHPTFMFRNSNIRYKNDAHVCEDIELLQTLQKKGKRIEVIPKILLRYRIHAEQVSGFCSFDKDYFLTGNHTSKKIPLKYLFEANRESYARFYHQKDLKELRKYIVNYLFKKPLWIKGYAMLTIACIPILLNNIRKIKKNERCS